MEYSLRINLCVLGLCVGTLVGSLTPTWFILLVLILSVYIAIRVFFSELHDNQEDLP